MIDSKSQKRITRIYRAIRGVGKAAKYGRAVKTGGKLAASVSKTLPIMDAVLSLADLAISILNNIKAHKEIDRLRLEISQKKDEIEQQQRELQRLVENAERTAEFENEVQIEIRRALELANDELTYIKNLIELEEEEILDSKEFSRLVYRFEQVLSSVNNTISGLLEVDQNEEQDEIEP